MVGLLLLVVIFIFLLRSFYKTVEIMMIWQLVLMHVNVGVDYTIFSLSTFIAIPLFLWHCKVDGLKLNSFPFLLSYIFVFLSFIFAGFPLKIGLIGNTIGIFFWPLMAWYSKDKIANFWNFIFLNLALFLIVIVSIGLLELSLGFNPIAALLEGNGIMNFVEASEDYIRFGLYRCRSLMVWCSTYGVSCGYVMITLLLCLYFKVLKNVWLVIVLSILAFIAVISTGTRSVYLSVIIGMLPLLIKYVVKIKYLIPLIFVLTIIYLTNATLFDQIFDSFIHSDEAGGSSVEMRESQFDAAYKFYMQHPLFGNGIGYVSVATSKSSQLLGAESCIFTIMIERGVFGLTTYIFFNLSMVLYLFKRKQYRFLVFIPLGILLGKIISLFPDINEPYPLFWISILIKAIDDTQLLKNKNI